MSTKTAPIGIFDSGIGGLTVAKAVMNALPNEKILYFGDTARVPYGIKSEETVKRYALEITDFLLEKGVKMILIACNTVSASAKEEIIEKAGSIPVLDVITAGSQAAFEQSNHTKIAVMGTLATVHSKAYVNAINQINGGAEVIQKACPLLVPLAEEGWTDNEVARQILKEYLKDFDGHEIDALILGCTHYPLFKDVIPEILESKKTVVIDSAESIAETAFETLEGMNMLNESEGTLECYVTDRPQRFQELAERFLGRQIPSISIVSLS